LGCLDNLRVNLNGNFGSLNALKDLHNSLIGPLNSLNDLNHLRNSLVNFERSGCGLKNNFDNLEKLGKLSRDINKFHYSVNYRFNYRFNYS